MPHLSNDVLDAVLALQITVAWAGEGRSSPRRLGWWDTDLVDDAGGGDLLARLMPQTHVWASLQAVREAARRVDAKARSTKAEPDRIRTLFFFGFAIDEQLEDRLASLKRSGTSPADTLRFLVPLGSTFSQEELTSALKKVHATGVAPAVAPGGRELNVTASETPDVSAQRLAAALVPFTPEYPLPFFKLQD